MRSRSRLLLLAFLLVAGTVAMAWDASAQEPVTSRFKLSIGGYIKPEFAYSDHNSPGGPGQTLTVQPPGTVAYNNGGYVASTQESRFNFTLSAPDWRGIKSTAFLEFDSFGIGGAGTAPPGVLRIRHAFFRLAGEGLGGSWNVTVGRTWAMWSFAPFYSGSTVLFAAGGWLNDRGEQINLTHTFRVWRDLAWENAIGITDDRNDTNTIAEAPIGQIRTRFIYTGWQGFQGGSRQSLNLGFGAMVGRLKATNAVNEGNLTPSPALTATRWALNGGIFLPILPGRSATDRTWALSAMAKGGYAEGLGNDANVGWTPLANASTNCVHLAWAGATGQSTAACAAVPLGFTGAAAVTGGNLNLTGGSAFLRPTQSNVAGAPINTRTGTLGVDASPQLQLVKAAFWDASGQFYLPWGFWISSGMKAIHFTITEDASPASLTVKRFRSYWGTLFYDMTPNIRWGLEYQNVGTNRRNSLFDGAENRVHFAGYYFF